jgi:DNA-binding response OmpR family regulator
MRLLLIEDEEDLRIVCQKVLEHAGFKVITSLDLVEIGTLLPTIDLVLSDFNMGLDFQTIRELAKKHNKPLLLMSANPDAVGHHDRFIAKPFKIKELVASLLDLPKVA